MRAPEPTIAKRLPVGESAGRLIQKVDAIQSADAERDFSVARPSSDSNSELPL